MNVYFYKDYKKIGYYLSYSEDINRATYISNAIYNNITDAMNAANEKKLTLNKKVSLINNKHINYYEPETSWGKTYLSNDRREEVPPSLYYTDQFYK